MGVADMPSIAYWWDVDDEAKFTKPADRILSWTDSIVGTKFIQLTAGKQSLYVPDGGDGLPAVFFERSRGDWFSTTGSPASVSQPYHVFIRFKQLTHLADQFLFASNSSKDQSQCFWKNSDGKFQVGGGASVATFADTTTNYQTLDIEFNGASSKIRQDGTLKATFNAGTDGHKAYMLGGSILGASTFDGYIRGMIVCDELQSESNMQVAYNDLEFGPTINGANGATGNIIGNIIGNIVGNIVA